MVSLSKDEIMMTCHVTITNASVRCWQGIYDINCIMLFIIEWYILYSVSFPSLCWISRTYIEVPYLCQELISFSNILSDPLNTCNCNDDRLDGTLLIYCPSVSEEGWIKYSIKPKSYAMFIFFLNPAMLFWSANSFLELHNSYKKKQNTGCGRRKAR